LPRSKRDHGVVEFGKEFYDLLRLPDAALHDERAAANEMLGRFFGEPAVKSSPSSPPSSAIAGSNPTSLGSVFMSALLT